MRKRKRERKLTMIEHTNLGVCIALRRKCNSFESETSMMTWHNVIGITKSNGLSPIHMP